MGCTQPGRPLAALAVLAAMTLAGCAAGGQESWLSALYRDHPLTGKIWNPAEQRFVSETDLRAALDGADFILIGEKHDNRDHHRLQARLVGMAASGGRRATIVFEMLDPAQEKALGEYLRSSPGNAAGIGAAVGWEKSGWPDWADYQPIADVALANGIAMLAGAMERGTTQKIAREGPAALGAPRAEALMLNRPVAEDLRADMRRVIHESHCGQLPETMLDPMVEVTLAKDAVMADRLIAARGHEGKALAILIAGDGHVRADWGVPMHLGRRLPETRTVNIGLMEVSGEAKDVAAYAEFYGGRLPFDFVWFTPRVDDDDPCEVFARQLQKMRQKDSQGGN